MAFELTSDILKYVEDCKEETIELLETLCKIPAPSGKEEKRAEFVKNWLTNAGCEGVYIDKALNVIYPVNCEGRDDIIVFLAHTDTVFPDLEPMELVNDGEYIHCPGVGDDTACLVNLMMVARYVAQNKIKSNRGVIFLANSCEEGLGNLKGTKQLMRDFEGRIKNLYAFDASYTHYANKCVGSHRYELTFKTEGGHSYGKFGNRNAIAAAADVICKLYECQVPKKENTKTTYNVGGIEGGTSVNTIAQEAKVLYEYRSDDSECLATMQKFFQDTIDDAKNRKIADIDVEVIGVRPCGIEVDEKELADMCSRVETISKKHSGLQCTGGPGSTDCNIPMSMGIPAISVGSYIGYGAHTREEKVLISSMPIGQKITFELILSYFD